MSVDRRAMTSGKQAKATSLSAITREEVTEMMVLVAMANGPMVLSSSKNSVDDTFVGRWHICNKKKCKGFPLSTTGAKFKNGLEGEYKMELAKVRRLSYLEAREDSPKLNLPS